MPMPPMPQGLPPVQVGGSATHASPSSTAAKVELPPVPFGKQMMQLVVVPALIALGCLAVWMLFGALVGRADRIEDVMTRLRTTSGAGNSLPGGLQDPRYKDRTHAALQLAAILPALKDSKDRNKLSVELQDVLRTSVGEQENELRYFLLMALGQLAQENSLAVLAESVSHPSEKARHGAVGGLLSWVGTKQQTILQLQSQGKTPEDKQELEAAQQQLDAALAIAVPAWVKGLKQADVRTKAFSSAALGRWAKRGDVQVVAALREVFEATGSENREAQWNAAVALARLGDPAGAKFVAEVLLTREALAKLAAVEGDTASGRTLSAEQQQIVIISTLDSADAMTHRVVWERIAFLAREDPDGRVRNQASKVQAKRPQSLQD